MHQVRLVERIHPGNILQQKWNQREMVALGEVRVRRAESPGVSQAIVGMRAPPNYGLGYTRR